MLCAKSIHFISQMVWLSQFVSSELESQLLQSPRNPSLKKAKALSSQSTVYALLTDFSSLQALIGAIQRVSTESERTNIVSFIAFIRHARPHLLTELEQVIASTDNHLDPHCFWHMGHLLTQQWRVNRELLHSFSAEWKKLQDQQ